MGLKRFGSECICFGSVRAFAFNILHVEKPFFFTTTVSNQIFPIYPAIRLVQKIEFFIEKDLPCSFDFIIVQANTKTRVRFL